MLELLYYFVFTALIRLTVSITVTLFLTSSTVTRELRVLLVFEIFLIASLKDWGGKDEVRLMCWWGLLL
jgi:hypothetical protein